MGDRSFNRFFENEWLNPLSVHQFTSSPVGVYPQTIEVMGILMRWFPSCIHFVISISIWFYLIYIYIVKLYSYIHHIYSITLYIVYTTYILDINTLCINTYTVYIYIYTLYIYIVLINILSCLFPLGPFHSQLSIHSVMMNRDFHRGKKPDKHHSGIWTMIFSCFHMVEYVGPTSWQSRGTKPSINFYPGGWSVGPWARRRRVLRASSICCPWRCGPSPKTRSRHGQEGEMGYLQGPVVVHN
jgi:hypothetical protein